MRTVRLHEVVGVTEVDIKKVVPAPDRDAYIVHLKNWRKIPITGLEIANNRLLARSQAFCYP